MKGKKIDRYQGSATQSPEAVASMLGATGNLRAPLLRVGSLVLVGFNEEVYRDKLC